MERVLISLVITTYNRAALLADALKSVAASQIESHGNVEVIVVDNNSTDDTRHTVEGINAQGFPFALRYIFERNQGLSYARNRGADEALGVYMAFMDDDQLIDKEYLARLEPAFRSTGAACVGGPCLLCDTESLPRWLPLLLQQSIEQRNYGNTVKVLGPDDGRLLGGNMAFVRQELLNVGKYKVNLGRCGDALLSGEEDELQDRLHAAGKKIVFHPSLIQYIPLAPARRKKSYWRRHHFGYGQSFYRMKLTGGMKARGRTLFGAPLWLWQALLTRDIPKTVWPLMHMDATKSFYGQLDVCIRLGQIREARRMAKQGKVR